MLLPNPNFRIQMDFLEYPSVSAEVRGAMVGGNLRITDTEVVFKHGKSGRKDVVKVAVKLLVFVGNLSTYNFLLVEIQIKRHLTGL